MTLTVKIIYSMKKIRGYFLSHPYKTHKLLLLNVFYLCENKSLYDKLLTNDL